MSKIKILHITQATIGGTLEYLKLFFTHINKDEYEVYLACPSYGPMKKEIENIGVKVYPLEMAREISLKDDLSSFIEMKRLIKKVSPDIVHLHSSKAGVLGKLASYLNRTPCIYNAHGWSFSMNVSDKKKKIYSLIEKYTSLFCSKIVNISEYEYNLAKQYKIASDKKLITIHNGIDIEKYKKNNYCKELILEELKIPQNSFIVGIVARISEQKDPIKFIEIAKKVCEIDNEIYFVWVGDGELRNEVEELVIRYNLENKIKITGWTNNVPKYISIFDIGILTSQWEGFGLSIVEYMASGKPVIASDIGGIVDIIKDDYNGSLVNVKDVNGFVDNIIKLKEDKNLRERYIRNGMSSVERKFTISRLIKEHEELYTNILGNEKQIDIYNRGI